MDQRGSDDERPEAALDRGGLAIELLRLPAALFGALVRLRGALYDRRLLPTHRVDAPVVCVGNLTTGGTGKTPMVALVLRELARRGSRPGLLSRGYRGRRDRSGSNPSEPLGDEARMIAREFPSVASVQDADRVRGAERLVGASCDAIVLDDGFQHRRLERDVDLVLVDATRPFGLAWRDGRAPEALLPRGLLREPLSALRRASACIITRSDQVEPQQLEALERRIQSVVPALPILRAVHRPTALADLEGATWPLERLDGRDVALVSGIGNADAFEGTVRALGANVIEHRRFRDHHHYTSEDVRGLGRSGVAVLSTAKDAVKLTDLLPAALVLRIEIEITRGRPILDALLDSLVRSGGRQQRDSLHEGMHG